MVKKFYILLCLLFLPISIIGQSYEINISLGSDFYKINDASTGFELADLTAAKIDREGFSNPMLLGVGLSYSLSPKYILSLEADFNYLQYSVKYSRNYPKLTNLLYIKTSNYDVPWARLGTSVNLDYIVTTFGDVKFLLGGGLGVNIFSPAVSSDFLYDTLLDKLSELDISDDISLGVFISPKLRGGIKYKIRNSKFNISLISNYSFVFNSEYEAPKSYMNLKMNIGYVL